MVRINSLLLFIVFLFFCENSYSQNKLAAYLMVYFKDSDHSLHMAVSKDGYSFTDVNNGNPVISGDTIAHQRGIRDPHIMRGPDDAFYMVMTDLHIYAKSEGYRDKEFERPREIYGWGNNRGFVLMRSTDLINWSHTTIAIDESFKNYEDIGCAWAPQTIYDEDRKQFMIYYSMRFKDGNTKLYYSYVNKDFTKLKSEPKLLFDYPKDITYIDADITKINNNYHMFYVPHDGTPGIKQATSKKINGSYIYDDNWYDSEDLKCEAPNIWKRIGEDKWVLMYDIYGLKPANFGFRETSDFKTFKDLGRFNEGPMKATNFTVPKHGAVVHITLEELTQLEKYWIQK